VRNVDAEPMKQTLIRTIVRLTQEVGIDVIAVGTALYGIEPTDDVRSALGDLDSDVAVLVKASRAAGLERVVAALTE
jgi:UDP-N-acetylmuramoyl-tripeptide--D-alanyl-D-alanine ligase